MYSKMARHSVTFADKDYHMMIGGYWKICHFIGPSHWNDFEIIKGKFSTFGFK